MKLYYWAFQMKALKTWLDYNSLVPWRQIEERLVKPHRLQDLPYSGIKLKTATLRFGPIISNSLRIWSTIEKHIGYSFFF
ncbi:UNVERIFIED_CONTAM: hypothetical protein FKN15_059299 [Acipenser sinensis]